MLDIATLIGIGGAFILIVVGILLGGGNIAGYINLPSIAITCGGTLMSIFAAYPMARVKEMLGIMRKLLFTTPGDPTSTIAELVNICTLVRREGLLALDAAIGEMKDPFLAKGAQYVVDGTDPDLTRQILELDVMSKRQRHTAARGMLDHCGAMAPAYGLIGTIIGLVAMLASLQDVATLGPKMAVSLLTTLYGSILANCVFIPGSKKLEEASNDELLLNDIIIEGLLGIQAGENPRNLENRLKAFLPIGSRDQLGDDRLRGMGEAA